MCEQLLTCKLYKCKMLRFRGTTESWSPKSQFNPLDPCLLPTWAIFMLTVHFTRSYKDFIIVSIFNISQTFSLMIILLHRSHILTGFLLILMSVFLSRQLPYLLTKLAKCILKCTSSQIRV